MGLKFSKELSTGFSAEYWKINSIYLNATKNVTILELALYKDKNSRDEGKDPVYNRTFKWEGENNPLIEEELKKKDPYVLSYEKIKELIYEDERDPDTGKIIDDGHGNPKRKQINEFYDAEDI